MMRLNPRTTENEPNHAALDEPCYIIGTAVAIGLGLAGIGAQTATGLVAANKSANAAKSAAQAQTNASNQAIDLQKQMYQQAMQLQSPYLNLGNSAVNTLGRLMTPGSGARYASPGPAYGAMMPGNMVAPVSTAPTTMYGLMNPNLPNQYLR